LSDCEEFVGVTERGSKWWNLNLLLEYYLRLSGDETLETGAAISKKLYG
tara:strand:- start:70 stop:216 length:147 start_codon:yes stop_codon:yes gene_type:complete